MIEKELFSKEQIRRINEAVLQNLPNRGGDKDRQRILRTNEEMRKDKVGGLPDDFGYVALNIPVPDMRVLQIRFPDLASLDYETQHKAWMKFIASEHSAPYKVRKNDGKKGVRHRGIIVR